MSSLSLVSCLLTLRPGDRVKGGRLQSSSEVLSEASGNVNFLAMYRAVIFVEVRPGAVGHEGVGVECLHGQVAQPAGARLLLLAAEINKYF